MTNYNLNCLLCVTQEKLCVEFVQNGTHCCTVFKMELFKLLQPITSVQYAQYDSFVFQFTYINSFVLQVIQL